MKLALHRSISFWSGLLVMTFICWAWRDSYRYDSTYITVRHSYSHFAGGLWLARYGTPITQWIGYRKPAPSGRLHRDPHLFQRPFFLRGQERPTPLDDDWIIISPSNFETTARPFRYFPTYYWALFIPHWLILLAIALLWLALLFLRSRRRAAASNSHSDESSNPSPP